LKHIHHQTGDKRACKHPGAVSHCNKTHVHPREVFADPSIDWASAIIVAHNHPAGGLTPSREDIQITKRLKDAGKTLGIKLLDHIIFNHKGYYSFLEKEKM
jgi:DNA repair protein RadC